MTPFDADQRPHVEPEMTVDDVRTMWNTYVTPAGLPKVARLTSTLRADTRLVLTMFPLRKDWLTVFGKTTRSSFLTGRVRNFRCNLRWVVQDEGENFVKILEGNYDDSDAIGSQASKTAGGSALREILIRDAAEESESHDDEGSARDL